MLKHTIFTLLLLWVSQNSFVYSDTDAIRISFFEQYAEWAITEMHRTGIPASITLAQAGFESNFGNSKLATQANNYFGIKCKSYWTGDSFYHLDDDKDTQGRPIASCFRSYHSIKASFKDHSNFLMLNTRYSALFEYGKTDYVNWAVGLQQKGYATAQDYALRLVDLIERYNLAQYDRQAPKQLAPSIPESVILSDDYKRGEGYTYQSAVKSGTPATKHTEPTFKKMNFSKVQNGHAIDNYYYHHSNTYDKNVKHTPIKKRLHVIQHQPTLPTASRR